MEVHLYTLKDLVYAAMKSGVLPSWQTLFISIRQYVESTLIQRYMPVVEHNSCQNI